MSRKQFQSDPQDKMFHGNWTKAKHAKSTINGQTQQSQTLIKMHNMKAKGQF